MESYCKELAKAYKDIAKSTKAAITGEPNYQKNLKKREKELAEQDEIEITDEELELYVKAQPSPYRMKTEEKLGKLKKVMLNG